MPAPLISLQTILGFQQAVINQGLEYNRIETPKNAIALLRDMPHPLQISLISHESQVGQLLVVTPQPKGSLERFVSEADAAIQAFESVWPATKPQIVHTDVTIRMLYETSSQHAFQELWESRLKQSPAGVSFHIKERIESMKAYIDSQVEPFIKERNHGFQ